MAARIDLLERGAKPESRVARRQQGPTASPWALSPRKTSSQDLVDSGSPSPLVTSSFFPSEVAPMTTSKHWRASSLVRTHRLDACTSFCRSTGCRLPCDKLFEVFEEPLLAPYRASP